MKVAAEMFAEKGFDAVSTRDLCAKANVNVAAISYYFGGKEGLYLEVFREYSQKLVERIESTLNEFKGVVKTPQDVEMVLRRFILTFINLRLNEPEMAIVLQSQSGDKIPGVREHYQTSMEPVAENLTRFFLDIQEAGLIRKDLNIRSFLSILIEAIWGYFSLQERGTNIMKDAYRLPEDQDRFVDFLVQLYTRGVTA